MESESLPVSELAFVLGSELLPCPQPRWARERAWESGSGAPIGPAPAKEQPGGAVSLGVGDAVGAAVGLGVGCGAAPALANEFSCSSRLMNGPLLAVLTGKRAVGGRRLLRGRDRVLVCFKCFSLRCLRGFPRRIDRGLRRIFWHERRRGWLGHLHDSELRNLGFLEDNILATPPNAASDRPMNRCSTTEASTAHQTLRRSRFGSVMAMPPRKNSRRRRARGRAAGELSRREIISPRPG